MSSIYKLKDLGIIAILAITLAACGGGPALVKAPSNRNQLRNDIRNDNSVSEKYSRAVQLLKEANTALLLSETHIHLLENNAVDYRQEVRLVREMLNSRNSELEKIQAAVGERVMPLLETAMETIDSLEKRVSKAKVVDIQKRAKEFVAEKKWERLHILIALLESSRESLAGLRDLYIGMYNDLIKDIRSKYRGFGEMKIEETASSRIIAHHMEQDGVLRGILIESEYGQPIVNAFIGIKTEVEGADYFFAVRTDENGAYQTPRLKPNTYYVDVLINDYLVVQSKEVVVSPAE